MMTAQYEWYIVVSMVAFDCKFLGHNAFGYNDSSPISNQIFVTRRASCSDLTFRNVHVDIRAKPVVHFWQRPYSHTYVDIRSLLWREKGCAVLVLSVSHFQLINRCLQQLNSYPRTMEPAPSSCIPA